MSESARKAQIVNRAPSIKYRSTPERVEQIWRVLATIASIAVFVLLSSTFRYVRLEPVQDEFNQLLREKAFYFLIMVGGGFAFFRFILNSVFPVDEGENPISNSRPFLKGSIIGAATGIAMYATVKLIVENSGADTTGLESLTRKYTIPVFLLTGLATPIVEELFYRNFMQNFMQTRIPAVVAILVSSTCFAMAHNPDARWILFPCGLIFGVLYWRAGLSAAIMAHAVYNTAILTNALSS